MTYFVLILAICFRFLTDLSFKLAVNRVSFSSFNTLIPNIRKVLLTPYVWLGGFFALINLGVWCLSLAHFDLSYAYPLFSIHYVAMIISGKLFFHEHLDRNKLLGMVFIGVGVFVLFVK